MDEMKPEAEMDVKMYQTIFSVPLDDIDEVTIGGVVESSDGDMSDICRGIELLDGTIVLFTEPVRWLVSNETLTIQALK